MHCQEELKSRSHNTSFYFITEVAIEAGLTVFVTGTKLIASR
jgi:hypothetical protein